MRRTKKIYIKTKKICEKNQNKNKTKINNK